MRTEEKQHILDRWPNGSVLEGELLNEASLDMVDNAVTFLKALEQRIGVLPMTQFTYFLGNDESTPLLLQQIFSKLYPCSESYYKVELSNIPTKNGMMLVKDISSINLDELKDYEKIIVGTQGNTTLRLEFDSEIVKDTKVIISATCYFRSRTKDEQAIYIGVKNGISDCFFKAIENNKLHLVFQQM